MSRGAYAPTGDHKSATSGALDNLQGAIESGNLDLVESLSFVGVVGPYGPIPQDEIEQMKHKEGAISAVGTGIGAESALHDNLAEARKRQRYTLRQVAEILDVSESTIRSWERGTVPSVKFLASLAKLYGVTTDWLLGMQSDEEMQLLDLYEYSTPTVRERIIQAVKVIQTGANEHADGDNYAETDQRFHSSFVEELLKRHPR